MLKTFVGEQQQIPPMYSAKKINGQKLYELARKNEEIDRDPVDITIYDIELLCVSEDTVRFRVSCSTGTYIRTLCEDIAARLSTVATMTSLLRTKIDKYSYKDAADINSLTAENARFISTYDILYHYPYYELEDLTDVMNGKDIEIDSSYQLVFITNNQRIIAAYEKSEGNIYRCKRGLW